MLLEALHVWPALVQSRLSTDAAVPESRHGTHVGSLNNANLSTMPHGARWGDVRKRLGMTRSEAKSGGGP